MYESLQCKIVPSEFARLHCIHSCPKVYVARMCEQPHHMHSGTGHRGSVRKHGLLPERVVFHKKGRTSQVSCRNDTNKCCDVSAFAGHCAVSCRHPQSSTQVVTLGYKADGMCHCSGTGGWWVEVGGKQSNCGIVEHRRAVAA